MEKTKNIEHLCSIAAKNAKPYHKHSTQFLVKKKYEPNAKSYNPQNPVGYIAATINNIILSFIGFYFNCDVITNTMIVFQ